MPLIGPEFGLIPDKPDLQSGSQSDCTVRLHRVEPSREAAGAVWDVLERFARDLCNDNTPAGPLDSALRAIRESLEADVVFSYLGTRDEIRGLISSFYVTPTWCRAFARGVLAESSNAEAELVRSDLLVASRGPPAPSSTAMVRMSRSRGFWLVAVSFHAEQSFGVAEVRIMSLVRQLLLNHWRLVRTQEQVKALSTELSVLARPGAAPLFAPSEARPV